MLAVRTDTKSCEYEPRYFIPAGAVQGANMAVRRAVFDVIGGFDELLGPGTPFIGEDIELIGRASWAGCRGG